ncbi:YopX family protein [Rossellomorea sp. FS2]|uniref:YopX family protein n=1 Tax=Rossellomorea sp. FS2 TaxID=3391447 RepID=UPI003A4D254E
MRKLKFRYWCTVENKMYDKAYVEEHINLAFMSELLDSAQERYIFQEFVGLNDKNGREIYEGDFLYFDVFDGLVSVSGTTQVYFADGCFRLNEHHPVADYIRNGTVEVVGNIYEGVDADA